MGYLPRALSRELFGFGIARVALLAIDIAVIEIMAIRAAIHVGLVAGPTLDFVGHIRVAIGAVIIIELFMADADAFADYRVFDFAVVAYEATLVCDLACDRVLVGAKEPRHEVFSRTQL